MYKTSGHVLCTYEYIITHHPTMRAQQVRGVRGCVAWSVKEIPSQSTVYCCQHTAKADTWDYVHSSSVCNRLCWTWVMVSIPSQCKGTVRMVLCTHVCTRQYHYSATWVCTESTVPKQTCWPTHALFHPHTHTQEGGSVSRPGGRGSTQKDRNLIIYFSKQQLTALH